MITLWIANLLSYTGRLQLIQNVLSSLKAFWGHVFISPMKLIKRIEGLCRNYLWSGADTFKRPPIALDSVCQPKMYAGLNLSDLRCGIKQLYVNSYGL